MQREMIFKAESKYGGLLVHIDDTDRHDYHTKTPACTGEVVRCRDCIYWKDEDFCANPQWQVGARPQSGLLEFPCTFPENFCSWGERRG